MELDNRRRKNYVYSLFTRGKLCFANDREHRVITKKSLELKIKKDRSEIYKRLKDRTRPQHTAETHLKKKFTRRPNKTNNTDPEIVSRNQEIQDFAEALQGTIRRVDTEKQEAATQPTELDLQKSVLLALHFRPEGDTVRICSLEGPIGLAKPAATPEHQ